MKNASGPPSVLYSVPVTLITRELHCEDGKLSLAVHYVKVQLRSGVIHLDICDDLQPSSNPSR